ncbi:MAG TPA: hypothetical protein VN370_13300 [Desulfitobacteriaceae bacterium]|nr:hypothetical protein [Desulfitobacteriaceae bacterium]
MISKTGKRRRKENRSRAGAYDALKRLLSAYPGSQGQAREQLRKEINILADKLQHRTQPDRNRSFYYGQK